MKYNVSKTRFVLLLVNSKNNKVDANCEKNEKVEKEIKKLCVIVIVSRDMRESVFDCFDRETIFAHIIDFFDVVINIKSEVNSLLIRFSNFVCFVRICS